MKNCGSKAFRVKEGPYFQGPRKLSAIPYGELCTPDRRACVHYVFTPERAPSLESRAKTPVCTVRVIAACWSKVYMAQEGAVECNANSISTFMTLVDRCSASFTALVTHHDERWRGVVI